MNGLQKAYYLCNLIIPFTEPTILLLMSQSFYAVIIRAIRINYQFCLVDPKSLR